MGGKSYMWVSAALSAELIALHNPALGLVCETVCFGYTGYRVWTCLSDVRNCMTECRKSCPDVGSEF